MDANVRRSVCGGYVADERLLAAGQQLVRAVAHRREQARADLVGMLAGAVARVRDLKRLAA